MSQLTDQEAEALLTVDTRELSLPNDKLATIAATWQHWIAFDELQAFYGWAEVELLRMVCLENEVTGRDLATCFSTVVAYIYADCRHEMAELVGADTWLPLLPSGYRPRNELASNEA